MYKRLDDILNDNDRQDAINRYYAEVVKNPEWSTTDKSEFQDWLVRSYDKPTYWLD